MISTFCKWFDVMNLFHSCEPPFFQALLTEWMLLRIRSSDSMPCSSISSSSFRISAVPFVVTVVLLRVFFAESAFRKIRTARKMTWVLWLPWHLKHLLCFEPEDVP